MSLIEEALRKQQDQSTGSRSSDPYAPPPVPTQFSQFGIPPPTDGSQRQRQALLIAIAAGFLLLVLLLAGGVVLFLGSWKGSSGFRFVKEAPVAVTAPAPREAISVSIPVVTALVQRTEDKQAVIASFPSNTVAATVSVAIASVVLPVVEPVVWPAISVRGVFTIGGKTTVLLGDGITLEVGATAPNGVRLVDAKGTSIRLNYRGEMRLYRRGGGSFQWVTNAIPDALPAP